jgi:hypothetical protein
MEAEMAKKIHPYVRIKKRTLMDLLEQALSFITKLVAIFVFLYLINWHTYDEKKYNLEYVVVLDPHINSEVNIKEQGGGIVKSSEEINPDYIIAKYTVDGYLIHQDHAWKKSRWLWKPTFGGKIQLQRIKFDRIWALVNYNQWVQKNQLSELKLHPWIYSENFSSALKTSKFSEAITIYCNNVYAAPCDSTSFDVKFVETIGLSETETDNLVIQPSISEGGDIVIGITEMSQATIKPSGHYVVSYEFVKNAFQAAWYKKEIVTDGQIFGFFTYFPDKKEISNQIAHRIETAVALGTNNDLNTTGIGKRLTTNGDIKWSLWFVRND